MTRSSFNDLLRRTREPQPPDHVGGIGIGVGGGSAARVATPTNQQINAKLRLAAFQATNRVDLGVDLRDVWA